MSGMNQPLIDRILGYNDSYTSTMPRRDAYHEEYNRTKARPNWILDLRENHNYAPRDEGSYFIQKLVESTLNRMMK